jgi:hypothetical protein
MNFMKNTILIFIVLFMAATSSYSQKTEANDSIASVHTLPDVTKMGLRHEKLRINKLETNVSGIRSVISPLGEGDPIKWVQNLPGVTTGADGTTAFYVRGSNMGNNLFSLDGVPVYGYSHLFGMTTIVPQSAMQNVSLTKGGFDGKENNFTAAHLNVETRTPVQDRQSSVGLNTFLFSAETEGRLCDGLTYLVSARISPLTWEYRAVRSSLASILGDLDDFKAGVGDVYAKLHWHITQRQQLSASVMGSIDDYSFTRNVDSNESMGWKNGIALLRWQFVGNRTEANVSASYNYYCSEQKQDKVFRGKENHLSLLSSLKEATVEADGKTRINENFKIGYGAKVKFATFEPGQVASIRNKSDVTLADAFVQGEYVIPDRLDIKAFARINHYSNKQDDSKYTDPEAGASIRWSPSKHFAVEGTFDRLVQYYHTLEGLPVGWSLDMIVPTVGYVAPETSLQGGLNFEVNLGHHSLSVGGYYKTLDSLVYYKYAQDLFSGGMAAWQDNVSIGQGKSYGCELLYTFQNRDFYARASYTWSKTDRSGFEDINDGETFHARFDRTHVLNLFGQWKDFSAAFTLQSGHWENGAPKVYTMHVIGGEEWEAHYFNGVNNYHMPMIIHLDLGYQHSFKTSELLHELNLGICNVTNHFNSFMLYYDADKESWTELALLPILPTFSYKVTF